MVPEFEKAIFGATAAGLLPNLVETSFGYHIIKVTAPNTKQTYQVAAVQKNIVPSDATREAAYQKAQELKGAATDLESRSAKRWPPIRSLQKLEAKGLGRGDQQREQPARCSPAGALGLRRSARVVQKPKWVTYRRCSKSATST